MSLIYYLLISNNRDYALINLTVSFLGKLGAFLVTFCLDVNCSLAYELRDLLLTDLLVGLNLEYVITKIRPTALKM